MVTESDFIGRERDVPFSTFRAPQVLERWFTPGQLERFYDAAGLLTAREVMSRPVVTISDTATVADAVLLMIWRGLRRLSMVCDDTLVRIVTRHDALRLMTGLVTNACDVEGT